MTMIPRRNVLGRPLALTVAGFLLAQGCQGQPQRASGLATTATTGVHWTVPHRFQEDPAACGPCALWSVLSFHSPDHAVDYAALDRDLRPPGSLSRMIGVLPGTLAATARRRGWAATVTTSATTTQVRQALDQGLPVIVLGEYVVGNDSRLHYVVVNGYVERPTGTTWLVTDSLVRNGAERQLSTADLQAFWDDVKLLGQAIPYQRTIITVAPPARAALLPPDTRDTGILALERTLHGLFNLFGHPDGNGPAPTVP